MSQNSIQAQENCKNYIEKRMFATNTDTKPKEDLKSIKAGKTLTLTDLLWPTDRMLKKRIAISTAFLILSKISTVAIPMCMSAMIDVMAGTSMTNLDLISNVGLGGLATTQFGLAHVYLVAYCAARISSSFFTETRNAIFSTVMERTGMLNASKMFMKIHCLDIDLLLMTKSGEISNVFTRGIKAISQVLRILVFQIAPTILEFTMVTALLCYKLGPAIASLTAGTMGVYVLFTALVTQKRMILRKLMVSAEQKAAGVFTDCITNAEAVRYYNAENRELGRYATLQCDYAANAVKVQQSLAMLNFGQNAIFNTGLFLSMWLTLNEIAEGTAQFGDLVLVNTLLFQLAIPLNLIGTMYRETKTSMVDLQKFLDLMKQEPKVHDMPDAKELIVKAGKIEFKNVCHAYENAVGATNILENFSLTLEQGKTVAIVGDSGTGKTTIAKLLFRLYDPSQGQILIDGQDIKHVTLSSLRNAIGIVPQDVVLFNESIAYNIKYGRPDATMEEVIAAAKLAGMHETIQHLKDGYDTVVGERGMKLSGGEKQRIGIARCFLKNTKILVFDEATSSLDSMTEHKVLAAFRKLSANRTTIVIAHRLSSILEADEIAVFCDGKIVQKGPADLLMKDPNGYLQQIIRSNVLIKR
ncbi:putative ABC transporter [Babesia sp. Xinjiang]|uniref:putative ABC transporter n=1 Tax=Babesia sp. Xinjiang TaxID=462227 RepID=UPI000A23486B|nr:putative ABC transporter [Babesia sp. Xinjiang]ORM40058.1 putative ABC transporter [Babesia sp. Xinjiang]